METRTALLPRLPTSPACLGGHGTCREGVVPSGLRKTRHTDSRRREQRVEIDYDKLRELCLQVEDEEKGGGEHASSTNREQRHRQFMANYRLLLRETPADGGKTAGKAPPLKRRCHSSCSIPGDCGDPVGVYVEGIHGHRSTKSVQNAVDTNSRLRAMLKILRKLPLQRDVGEVNLLSNHLSHFPSLLPASERDRPSVLVGVAARCLLETIPKKGFSLPDKGGVYLILQGSVERKTRDEATQNIISSQLHEGDCFGAMEENFVTKPSYPMYVTSSRCALMRITTFDYQRVLQNCDAAERRERLALIGSCPAMSGVSRAVIAAMASDIHWETLPPNTILMDEGEMIRRVGFIQTGSCTASMEVPQARPGAQLVIGRLGPGSCVGEALLRGSERQPYKVYTNSRVKIGWVPSTTITMNEVVKLIPAEKELLIPVPRKDMVRHKYAKELMGLHWKKIKSDVLSEARGDQPPQPEPVRWKI